MKIKVKKAYNTLGREYYDTRKNKSGISYFYNELLEMPTTLKMLGNIKGKKVLDLGCGPGIYIQKLKNKCKEIKGIDISKVEVEIAKENNPEIDIVLGDAEKLPYNNNEFDIIFASLVLGHLDSWTKVLSEISRTLKKRGIFIFSIHNPVTDGMIKKKWFFKKFKVIERYFEERKRSKIWGEKNTSAESIHYHKTYGTIIRNLIKNKFEIIDYEDCKPLEEGKGLFPKHYNNAINLPYFSVFKVRKK